LTCPICNKRKAKRFCPARADTICSVCCGTEREVTIDCPSDCTYLVESRKNDMARLEIDWSKVPFPESKFDRRFAQANGPLLFHIDLAICRFAAEHRATVDTDVVAVLKNLAESYRTQASGIIYEKPLDYALHRALDDALKAAITEFREKEAQRVGMTTVRDGDIRDSLIFLTQLAAVHENGRPKGRAYLDLIRQQFPKEQFEKSTASGLVLP
jgi:hypothetical protein